MTDIEGSAAGQRLRSYIERIERLNEEIKELNADKADLFTEVKSAGYDVKAVKRVIQRRAADPQALSELEQLVALYESALGTPDATRAARAGARDAA